MTIADMKGRKQGKLRLAVVTTTKYLIPYARKPASGMFTLEVCRTSYRIIAMQEIISIRDANQTSWAERVIVREIRFSGGFTT
jgi:hypothetical protein